MYRLKIWLHSSSTHFLYPIIFQTTCNERNKRKKKTNIFLSRSLLKVAETSNNDLILFINFQMTSILDQYEQASLPSQTVDFDTTDQVCILRFKPFNYFISPNNDIELWTKFSILLNSHNMITWTWWSMRVQNTNSYSTWKNLILLFRQRTGFSICVLEKIH